MREEIRVNDAWLTCRVECGRLRYEQSDGKVRNECGVQRDELRQRTNDQTEEHVIPEGTEEVMDGKEKGRMEDRK